MPAGQPFTHLCQLLARGRHASRVDLHLHTTFSDGNYSPAQVVEVGRRCGLSALAITDHDTTAGVLPARQAAAGSDLEVLAGVEITTEHHEHELHLLAYFVDLENQPLQDALAWVRQQREVRFRAMTERLREQGVQVPEATAQPPAPESLGRRYLAELLVRTGQVGSIREAFARYLRDGSHFVVPKKRLVVAQALELCRGAEGVASWAHPPHTCDRRTLAELRDLGLDAVEVDYPAAQRSRRQQLRSWAVELGLAVTGGSDCHGPGQHDIGCCTISAEELLQLRQQRR